MKKLNKFIALILSLVMTMSFTVIGNAESTSERLLSATTDETPFGFGLDLNPENIGVGETLSAEATEYTQKFTYRPEVDCSLNFQINKTSQNDKHKNNGTYTVVVEKAGQSIGTYYDQGSGIDALKELQLIADNKYTFIVTRNYSPAVKEVYIGITTKVNLDVISSCPYNGSFAGDTNISKYYVFTPAADGGYFFKMTPHNGCTGAGKAYILTVYSKIGSSVYESASYEKGVSDSNLRLYLKAGVEYVVKTESVGGADLGYDFSVESVQAGPNLSLVGAQALSLDNETGCTLYPFANRRAFAWYSFTAPKDGCFEFKVNNRYDSQNKGDIVVELRDETFSPVEDGNILYLYENETGVISNTMKQGEVCYIQVSEMFKGNFADVYSVGVRVKEHAHTNEIVIDGNYIIKGCPCQVEEAMDYAFWLDKVKINNVAYTGKTVKPKASLVLTESYCKEGSKIGIPASAYTVTLTGNNKKNIGSAKAKVKFTGTYKALGTYNVNFKIVPKGTTLSKVSVGDKSFTAKWKKQTKMTNGYELRYSQYEGMNISKTISIGNTKTLSKKVSGLKEKTDYFVQVRTYKKVNGKKYCSSWSTKTKVTVE